MLDYMMKTDDFQGHNWIEFNGYKSLNCYAK
jgi:hypothetical protein